MPAIGHFAAAGALKIGDQALSPVLREAGYSAEKTFTNQIPPAEALIEMWAKGMLTLPELELWIQFHGIPILGGAIDITDQSVIQRAKVWNKYLFSQVTPPDVALTLDFLNRDWITRDTARKLLSRNGISDRNDQDIVLSSRHTIPSISDMVRFAIRETFNIPLSEILRHYDELPQTIRTYFGWQGLGYPIGFQINRDGGRFDATWADMFWASHWTPLAPTQAYEMLYRLRPGRVQRYWHGNFQPPPFSLDDVRRWLRVNEYPAGVRDQLAAIAYRPINTRYLTQALRWETHDAEWVTEHLLDLGYAPVDVPDIVQILQQAAHPEVRTAERSWIRKYVSNVEKMVKAGAVATQDAINFLVGLGMRENFAQSIVEAARNEMIFQHFQEGVKAEKKAFMDGFNDAPATRINLTRIGMTDEAIQQHIDVWTVQRDAVHRTASTSQILDWLGKGLVTEDDATKRLRNLGWLRPDSLILIADEYGKVLQRQQKIAAAQAKTAQQQAKQLQAIQEKAAKQAAALAKRLCDMTPIGKLMKWLSEGVINVARFRARLLACGYTPEIIALYIMEAAYEKRQAEIKSAAKDARHADQLRRQADAAAARAKKASQKKAAKQASGPTWIRWFVMGIVNQETLVQRLQALGYPDDIVEGMVEEANTRQLKSTAKTGGKTQVEQYGIGTASDTGLPGP